MENHDMLTFYYNDILFQLIQKDNDNLKLLYPYSKDYNLYSFFKKNTKNNKIFFLT